MPPKRSDAERPMDVVERRLEEKFRGEFEFTGANGPRRIPIRGVVDRIDILADGTFRLIDYKLSSAPNKAATFAAFEEQPASLSNNA